MRFFVKDRGCSPSREKTPLKSPPRAKLSPKASGKSRRTSNTKKTKATEIPVDLLGLGSDGINDVTIDASSSSSFSDNDDE